MAAKAPVATQDEWDSAAAETAIAVPEQEYGSDIATRSYSSDTDFDPEDVQIPRIRLAQKTTAEVERGEAEAGQLVLMGAAPRSSVVVIPVAKGKAREFRDQDDNRAVLCQSPDAKVGFGDPGGACAACPMNRWGKNPRTGKGVPPACTLIYSYVVFDVDEGRLATIEFKKTAANQAKFMNSMLHAYGMGKTAFRLSGERKTAGGNSYYAPIATPLQQSEIPQETWERASLLASAMLGAPDGDE